MKTILQSTITILSPNTASKPKRSTKGAGTGEMLFRACSAKAFKTTLNKLMKMKMNIAGFSRQEHQKPTEVFTRTFYQ